jgi:hypothetical protein
LEDFSGAKKRGWEVRKDRTLSFFEEILLDVARATSLEMVRKGRERPKELRRENAAKRKEEDVSVGEGWSERRERAA